MAGDYTEVSSTSWLSRLGNAIKGVLIGLLLFVISFPLLFWNEGRAVHTAQGLAEGEKSVVSVSADKVEAANDGKLVHVSGLATTDEELKDPEFLVSAKAIRLQRTATMYQYVEHVKEEKRKKLGGGEETVKTYTYTAEWSATFNDSDQFRDPNARTDKRNPPMKFQDRTETARVVTLGAFQMSESLVNQISKSEALPVTDAALARLPVDVKESGPIKVAQGVFYLGTDSASPKVGDMKIAFSVVNPTDVSILAKQVGKSFEPYKTSVEGSPLINRLQLGKVSAAEMFEAAQSENTVLTWILRLVGYILMAVGIALVFQPLVIIADVIPFIGSMLGMGVALFAGLVALPLTLITIAIGWIAYRPLLGLGLLGLAAGVFIAFYMLARNRKAAAKMA